MDVVADLVAAGKIDENDAVLEVGPGLGNVTAQLVEKAERVMAVEIDSDLVARLHERFDTQKNLEIIHADILSIDIKSIKSIKNSYKIVSSLPYQITSPFLHKVIFGELGDIQHLSLIIQKEVADKICAKPPKASYWSNLISLWGRVDYLQTIAPSNFDPPPKVYSALIKLQKHLTPLFSSSQPNTTMLPTSHERIPSQKHTTIFSPTRSGIQHFANFLHHGFSSPRKMLNKVFEVEDLNKAGIDPQRRAETLTLEEWQTIYKIIHA